MREDFISVRTFSSIIDAFDPVIKLGLDPRYKNPPKYKPAQHVSTQLEKLCEVQISLRIKWSVHLIPTFINTLLENVFKTRGEASTELGPGNLGHNILLLAHPSMLDCSGQSGIMQMTKRCLSISNSIVLGPWITLCHKWYI